MSAMSQRPRRMRKSGPTHAVLGWLSESHAHGSLLDYTATLMGATDDALPLARLRLQIAEGVLGPSGHPPDRSLKSGQRHRLQLADREVAMLYYLAVNTNLQVAVHHATHWLQVAQVATLMGAAGAADDEQDLTLGREQTGAALRAAYLQADVVTRIAVAYYEGQSPLFPEIAADVAALTRQSEQLLDHCNAVIAQRADVTAVRRPRPAGVAESAPKRALDPLTLAEVHAEAAAALPGAVALQGAVAKAEARDLTGERERGMPLLARLC